MYYMNHNREPLPPPILCLFFFFFFIFLSFRQTGFSTSLVYMAGHLAIDGETVTSLPPGYRQGSVSQFQFQNPAEMLCPTLVCCPLLVQSAVCWAGCYVAQNGCFHYHHVGWGESFSQKAEGLSELYLQGRLPSLKSMGRSNYNGHCLNFYRGHENN